MERIVPKTSYTECDFLSKPNLNLKKMTFIKGQKPIYANLFKVNINKNWVIYKYPVSFLPEISKDNPRIKRALYKVVEPAVTKIFGVSFLSGEILYSFKKVTDKTQIPFTNRDIEYTFIIDPFTNEFSINDENPLQTPAIKQVYELMFNEILHANPHLEFYKNLFVKSSEVQTVASQKNKVEFYPGYSTSLMYTTMGTYLNVTIKNKILSTCSCYEIIESKKKSKGKFTKEEQDDLKEYFIGRSIKTVYNKRNYVLDDMSFEKTPKNTSFNKDGINISLMNYYKTAHGLTLKYADQPIFIVNKKGANDEVQSLYFIPELCKLAGIDDNATKDGNFMKELAKHTKLEPKGRVKKINDFMDLINDKTPRIIEDKKTKKVINKEMSAFEKKELFTLSLSPAEKNNFSGCVMDIPSLTCGKNKNISSEERKPFPVFNSKDLVSWICMYHKENYDDAVNLYESMKTASKAYGINVGEPEWIETGSKKAADWKSDVEDYLKSKNKYDIVVFVLDRYKESLYKELKKHSLTVVGYVSQVVKGESLAKNAMSVASKLLLQINYKLGGSSYKVNFAKEVNGQNLMIVAVDSSHIAGKRTGVAMVATTNTDFTEYYNKIEIISETKKETLAFCVSSFLEEAVAAYFEKAKARKSKYLLPSGIIIYRQGVSREQKQFLKSEVANIELFLTGEGENTLLKDNPIPYYYVLVNTKTHYKFFEKTTQKNMVDYINPSSGLLVLDSVTDPNFYEFYIQPQVVTQGTATPSCFHVAFGNMKEPEIVPKLTFDLCFLYANWQGPVRVPGPLKAAEKLSKMTAKYTKAELCPNLKNSQVYL